jgi:hypothetical protein
LVIWFPHSAKFLPEDVGYYDITEQPLYLCEWPDGKPPLPFSIKAIGIRPFDVNIQ